MMDYWYWLIAGMVLITIEMLVPSFFALWLGIAAILTGGVYYFFPTVSWEYQILLFAILSIINVTIWRQFYLHRTIKTDMPTLNRRGEQYIGRVITLKSPIEDNFGKVRLDDSLWTITGQDCPIGTKVKIIHLENVVFHVEAID